MSPEQVEQLIHRSRACAVLWRVDPDLNVGTESSVGFDHRVPRFLVGLVLADDDRIGARDKRTRSPLEDGAGSVAGGSATRDHVDSGRPGIVFEVPLPACGFDKYTPSGVLVRPRWHAVGADHQAHHVPAVVSDEHAPIERSTASIARLAIIPLGSGAYPASPTMVAAPCSMSSATSRAPPLGSEARRWKNSGGGRYPRRIADSGPRRRGPHTER